MTSLGSSIYACRNINRHITALEPDEEIFKALLAPLIWALPTLSPPHLDPLTIVDDINGKEIEIERIMKKSQFSK